MGGAADKEKCDCGCGCCKSSGQSSTAKRLVLPFATSAFIENTVLAPGEIVFGIDNCCIYTGDGVTKGGKKVGELDFGSKDGLTRPVLGCDANGNPAWQEGDVGPVGIVLDVQEQDDGTCEFTFADGSKKSFVTSSFFEDVDAATDEELENFCANSNQFDLFTLFGSRLVRIPADKMVNPEEDSGSSSDDIILLKGALADTTFYFGSPTGDDIIYDSGGGDNWTVTANKDLWVKLSNGAWYSLPSGSSFEIQAGNGGAGDLSQLTLMSGVNSTCVIGAELTFNRDNIFVYCAP